MDSSRYWNTVRSREDFERTRDLWATGKMEVTDIQDGSYVYARGNATNAYQPSKMERFTREVAYTPTNDVLVVFDRVRTTDPNFKYGALARDGVSCAACHSLSLVAYRMYQGSFMSPQRAEISYTRVPG